MIFLYNVLLNCEVIIFIAGNKKKICLLNQSWNCVDLNEIKQLQSSQRNNQKKLFFRLSNELV